MLSFKWLGVSGERGSNHVVLQVAGGQRGHIMLSFKWLGVSGGQVAGGLRGVKSCCRGSAGVKG